MPLIRPLATAALALAVTATSFGCGAPQTSAPDLDVRRVVLYQSGVAYLERSGDVSGDHLVMRVRPDQINDVLASLVVVDHSGGGATSVSLPVDQRDVRDVAALPAGLENGGGMAEILGAFRGADVVVHANSGRTRGRVTGVEEIAGVDHVTIMTPSSDLVPIALAHIERVDLESDTLAVALERSLDRSLSDGQWKPIEVTVRFADDRRRRVSLAYVVEMPIWKPAYRAVATDGGLLLQGWAIVDNVSGEDWTDVRLSLTAGTPLSFRYDLHSPVYVDRPDMTGYGMPSIADLRPPTPTQSVPGARMARAQQETRAASAPMPAPQADMAYGGGRGGFAMAEEAESWDDDGISFDALADTGSASADVSEVSALHRFDIRGRVTVPDQSSTMVTLVNEAVTGDDVLLYQPSGGTSSTHPWRALFIENDTMWPIQRAPIAIYRDDTFVGEGITPSIAPGEQAFVSYAVEAQITINQRHNARSGDIELVRIADGHVHVEQESLQIWTHEITSSLDDAHTTWVQVPRYDGFELVDAPSDVQPHPGRWLVPVEVNPGRATVDLTQRRRLPTRLEVFDPRVKTMFAAWITRPDARPDVVAALQPIHDMLEELAALDQRIAESRQLRSDVQVRTAELRANIAALGDSERNADLRRDLVERLANQERILEDIAADIVERSEEQSALRVRISEAMREVTLDVED